MKNPGGAERLLQQSEQAQCDPLQNLAGLLHDCVGIDRERGQLTNVSVWDSLEHPHPMDTLQATLARRPVLEAAGVKFEVITNHEALWAITP